MDERHAPKRMPFPLPVIGELASWAFREWHGSSSLETPAHPASPAAASDPIRKSRLPVTSFLLPILAWEMAWRICRERLPISQWRLLYQKNRPYLSLLIPKLQPSIKAQPGQAKYDAVALLFIDISSQPEERFAKLVAERFGKIISFTPFAFFAANSDDRLCKFVGGRLCRASSTQRSRSRVTFVIFPATPRPAPSSPPLPCHFAPKCSHAHKKAFAGAVPTDFASATLVWRIRRTRCHSPMPPFCASRTIPSRSRTQPP